MSRFLFVVPPLVGHVNPLAAVAAELTARGHEVAWAGHADLLRRLVGPAAPVHDCALPDTDLLHRPPELTGPAAFRFLWQDFFVPLADAMAPGVAAAVERVRPDLVVADQHAVAGSLVAERLGVPCATSASTSAELVDPLAGLPKVAAWLAALLADLRRRVGDPTATHDPRHPPAGVVAFTTADLVGEVALPPGVRMVGPAIAPRPAGGFPWDRLDPGRRTVLVSLGTANVDAGERFLRVAVAALAARPHVQGVVVDPGGVLGHVPEAVVVPHVPQLELLARCAAVVCHSGHNTVCESLWHGVPLVLAPIRDDQPVVAGQVVAAGAGVRVRFGRVTAEGLGDALDTVLSPASGHRDAARSVGRSFRAAGGAPAAADHLAALAARSPVRTA
ncbi:glycosyltransferase [Actinosynnema sp. NPDC047251]|uniref:Glycosyltransferase, family 1 n=1 Tax=Saccharothrix espanaensis (strain ATCC 51144 / DSM 44229 / JCM 9112 / NBRC 15066 / NRRL 15764) TaxID=1179773 RepID=K0K4R8_SACES|nr:glycosyltransferase [Saccharothrix espanaensis]CCH31869.1 Glycosyltransferase, family 1 [Saccharothrix espanaensis DSM 44229]